jgi:hypothetical protein
VLEGGGAAGQDWTTCAPINGKHTSIDSTPDDEQSETDSTDDDQASSPKDDVDPSDSEMDIGQILHNAVIGREDDALDDFPDIVDDRDDGQEELLEELDSQPPPTISLEAQETVLPALETAEQRAQVQWCKAQGIWSLRAVLLFLKHHEGVTAVKQKRVKTMLESYKLQELRAKLVLQALKYCKMTRDTLSVAERLGTTWDELVAKFIVWCVTACTLHSWLAAVVHSDGLRGGAWLACAYRRSRCVRCTGEA